MGGLFTLSYFLNAYISDAFRAGLLKWLSKWFDWITSAKIWVIAAGYCVQFHGAQNHFINKSLIEEHMLNDFWEEINLW